jgi:hypothetical protein
MLYICCSWLLRNIQRINYISILSLGAALHVKTLARNAEAVEKIAVLMSPKDLEIEDNCGCTAMEGITKMATCMIREKEGIG